MGYYIDRYRFCSLLCAAFRNNINGCLKVEKIGVHGSDSISKQEKVSFLAQTGLLN